MKIKIVGTRKPWIDGAPRAAGWTGEVDDDTAKAIIANGMAVQIEDAPKPKRRTVKK